LIGRLRFAPLLAILLAAGLGMRLAYVIGEGAADPTYALPILDGAYYIDWASAIASGEAGAFAGHPGEAAGAFYLAPLYPLFLAGFLRIFGENFPLLFYVQQLLSVASAGFLAVAGKRLVSERAGLVAAVLFLAYHPLLFFASRPLGEALAIFLLTGAIAVGAGRRVGSGFGSGLLVGAATLARPNLLLVGGAWFLAGVPGRNWKRSGLFAAGLLLAVLPTTVRNLALSGHPVPVSANGGMTLYHGNAPEA
jgi:4-amino-4-deoxy-L-arabinose transferase-like glycosyltransferase